MSENLHSIDSKDFSEGSSTATLTTFGDGSVYLIGEFAIAVGLEAKTIRFYEKAGLIRPKRLGRMRVYTRQDVERLKAVRYLRQLGLPIRQIKALVDQSRDFTMEKIATPEVASFLSRHLEDMHRKHMEYENTIRDLSERLKESAAA